MTLSLNEVETLARKATRGAGYSWGLAEDAGRAVRWLQAHGLDGADAIAGLLTGERTTAPTSTGAVWTADTPLCPLTCGAALCDLAAEITGDGVRLGPTRQPLLLAPFAAWAAEATSHPMRLTWADAELHLGPGAQGAAPHGTGLTTTLAPGVQLLPLTAPITGTGPTESRATLSPDIYAALDALAQRTYAPATEASRLAGAGAGLTDND